MEHLHNIFGVVVLDVSNARIFAKYFPTCPFHMDTKKQRSVEREVVEKLGYRVNAVQAGAHMPADGDVMLFDGLTIVYKVDPEVIMMVLGGPDDNEVLLSSVLSCAYEATTMVLKCGGAPLDKRVLLENYDALILVVDEMIDNGVLLEINASSVAQEVQPFVSEQGDGPMKALNQLQKYLKQNM